MPEIQHGRLTLTLCPDGEWTAPTSATPMADMRGMTSGSSKKAPHERCPYAATAATPFWSGGPARVLPLLAVGFTLLAAFALPPLSRRALHERPYTTGPPIPA